MLCRCGFLSISLSLSRSHFRSPYRPVCVRSVRVVVVLVVMVVGLSAKLNFDNLFIQIIHHNARNENSTVVILCSLVLVHLSKYCFHACISHTHAKHISSTIQNMHKYHLNCVAVAAAGNPSPAIAASPIAADQSSYSARLPISTNHMSIATRAIWAHTSR